MPTEEEIKIKIIADTSDFKKGMEEAAKATEKLEKASDKGPNGKGGFSSSMEQMSKTTEGVKDKFKGIGTEGKKSGGILGKAFNGVRESFLNLGASSKLATAGTIGLAVAAVGIVGKLAAEAYKKIMGFAGEMTKMYNPAGFEKATNQMNASLTKMKTSLGAVLEPLYKAMTSIVGGIADALNGVLETVIKIYGWFVGFIGLSGTLSREAEDYSDAMEEATASADAGLSAFDKLNTLDTSGMGDATQAQRIRDLMADAAESAKGVRENILESLNPMKMMSQLFKSMGLESQWTDFVESGKKAWERISEIGGQIWDGFTSMVTGYWDFLKRLFSGMFDNAKSILNGVFDIVVEYFKNIAAPIVSVFSGIWSAVFNLLSGNIDGAVEAIKSGFQGAFQAVMDFFPNMWNKFKEVASNIFDTLSNTFQSIFGGIDFAGIFSGIVDAFKNIINSIIDLWNNSIANIGWEIDVLGNKVGINTYGLKIPKLASGAVMGPNDPFLAVVGDNTREREIISPESAMEDVFRRVLSERGGMSGVEKIELTVNLDGRKVARGIYTHLESESRRRGVSQWQ